MNILPNEIVSLILSFITEKEDIPSVMMTSKRFYDVGQNVLDFARDKNFAIRFSSSRGNVIALKFLLSNMKVDPSAWDNEALECACQNGRLGCVELLLEDERVCSLLGNTRALRTADYQSQRGQISEPRKNYLMIVDLLLKKYREKILPIPVLYSQGQVYSKYWCLIEGKPVFIKRGFSKFI